MTRTFLLDEQLSPGLVARFKNAGFEAAHVAESGFAGGADMRIWRYAARSGAVLLTKDSDFAALARASSGGPQVVWIRLGNTTTAAMWAVLAPLMPEIIEALDLGERLIEIR